MAKKLLTKGDYKHAFGHSSCHYRIKLDDEDTCRRCIFGRLMFGHIPESHKFWDLVMPAIEMMKKYPIFKEKFPWMNPEVVSLLQNQHDSQARNWEPEASWETIEREAKKADVLFEHSL